MNTTWTWAKVGRKIEPGAAQSSPRRPYQPSASAVWHCWTLIPPPATDLLVLVSDWFSWFWSTFFQDQAYSILWPRMTTGATSDYTCNWFIWFKLYKYKMFTFYLGKWRLMRWLLKARWACQCQKLLNQHVCNIAILLLSLWRLYNLRCTDFRGRFSVLFFF